MRLVTNKGMTVLIPFPGVKRPRRGVNHPPPSSAEVKGRIQLYLYSPSGPSWHVVGRTLPLAVLIPQELTRQYLRNRQTSNTGTSGYIT
jgi:hypothetical protein